MRVLEELRQLRREEVEESIRLDQFAFQFDMPAEELEKSVQRADLNELYGVFSDGKLLAKLALLRLQTYVNGRVVPMGGIAGVATWPEHRRGGRVAALLKHSFQVMREEGLLVSHLTPFAFSFYRKYGYEHTIDRKQYTIEKSDWPLWKSPLGRVERMDDHRVIAPVYEQYAARFSGTLARSDQWWETRVKHAKAGSTAVYYDEQNQPTGYMLYKVKSGEMTVFEFVFLNEQAQYGLWGFIGNHDSMASKATVVVPVDDPLPFLLSNPRIQQEIIPFFMTRIVDVERFLMQYTFGTGTSTSIDLCVTDPHAPWNEGRFRIRFQEAGGHPFYVERMGEAVADETNTVRCDIATLTCLLFGYKRPEMLATIGRLSGDARSIEALEQRVPSQTTFLYDSF